MDRDDRDAIRRVLNGDRDAYRVLMQRYFVQVHRVAWRITGDEADAEEAAQEAFLRAYNKLPGFRMDAQFSTWITRIAMNSALNLVERRNRDLSRTAERIDSSDGMHTPHTAATPERAVLDAETAQLRRVAMATLTPMERTAFTMRHMEDVPVVEIAAALNIQPNAAKQAIFRAVGKLRRALAPVAGGMA
ncbi:MAG: sigma-70 family RNA polymerase sigma factor [Acidobacteria bacterium]|nr:sigma-70 family RNA polymerase sigma factor [Acidobacteriota bacterium]